MASGHCLHMRRTIGSVPRTTLYVLLLAGCADNGGGAGFTATQGTEGTTAGGGETSTSSSSTGAADDGAGVPTTTNTTGAGLPTTGETSTGAGTDGVSSSGAVDSGETEQTGTTGTTGEITTGTTGTTGEDTAGAPSFLVDIWPIFEDRCSCHDDANGAGKLRLAMEDAYTNMVDMPSDQVPEMMLVKPGSAQDSYLWHKLNDTQDDVGGEGKKMPPSGKLKMDQLDLVQQWIDGGAKP